MQPKSKFVMMSYGVIFLIPINYCTSTFKYANSLAKLGEHMLQS